jgi:hypothetical protein
MKRLAVVLVLMLIAPTTASAQMAPPVQLPPGACMTSQLAVSFVESQGAAGTILDVLALTNVSGTACVLNGYVTVHMLDASSAPMPTVSVPGGGIFSGFPGPSPVMLAPGAAAPFGITWSDVPTGAETTCPAADSLLITPPGQITSLSLTGVTIAPCNSGTIRVGPIRAPGSAIPS